MSVSLKTKPISLFSQVVAGSDQVAAQLDGEVVILGFQSGSYYGLDEVGASVWEMMQEPRIVSDICNAILEEYDVAREDCERDLLELLTDLASKQLIEVENYPNL